MKFLKRAARIAIFLPALLLPVGAGFAAPAMASEISDAKALVNTAKTHDIVGEQGDGYLGFVQDNADAALKAAVAKINAGRAGVYRNTAASTGVTPQAAGEATAQLLFQKMSAGEYYKPLGGDWMQKR